MTTRGTFGGATPVGIPVAIGVGSNLGDRWSHLATARAGLDRLLEEPKWSPVYETRPRLVVDQPRFLNAVCVGRSTLEPRTLLDELQCLERAAGRTPGGPRFGPRVLDLDLLLYGDEVVDEPGLSVPHPRMSERGFVLVPLADVAPRWVHPGNGVSVRELKERAGTEGVDGPVAEPGGAQS